MSNQTTQPTPRRLAGEVISTYSRAQSLEVGVLIDAGPMAREADLRWPVALTAAAWEDCVAWSKIDSDRQVPQDEAGRIWDVLYMGAYAVRTPKGGGSWLDYALYRVPRDGHSKRARLTRLRLVVGPGDDGEPVITILLRNEDWVTWQCCQL